MLDLPKKRVEIEREAGKPVSQPILAENPFEAFDRLFDTGETDKIQEGRRIEFFAGRRKVKDGTTKKTGHHYWQWVLKDPDTGKRKRPYGGAIATVPSIYQYRARQYQAVINTRSPESLADTLFRPSLVGLQNGDTGTQ